MKKTIVIIDDNKDFLNQIIETMQLSGYEPHGFTRSRAAFKEIPQLKPDVILLDLRLDGENGCDVARKLKDNPDTSQIPIIAITAYYDEETHHYLKNVCGVNVCLKKPLRPLDVISQVENHFRKNKKE